MSLIDNSMVSGLFDQDDQESYFQSFKNCDDDEAYTPTVGINTGDTADLLQSLPLYRIEGSDYHDYSQTDFETVKAILKPPKPKRKGPRGGVVLPFPVRLHNMLEGVEKEGLTHVVSWQPHGRSFLLHKPKEFAEIVMPKYFKQSKLTSFQRQMNLYGFRRISSGTDRGAYYHELFLRTRLDIAKIMFRTKFKSGEDEFGNARHSYNMHESSFYDISLAPVDAGQNHTTEYATHTTSNTQEIEDIFDDSEDCVSEWGNMSSEGIESDYASSIFDMLDDTAEAQGMAKAKTPSQQSAATTEANMSDDDLERALECLISTHKTYLENLAPIQDNEIEPTPLTARCMDATNGVLLSAQTFFADKTVSLAPAGNTKAEVTLPTPCDKKVHFPDRKRAFSEINSYQPLQHNSIPATSEINVGPNVISSPSSDSATGNYTSMDTQRFLAEMSNNYNECMNALNQDVQASRKVQRINGSSSGADNSFSLSRSLEGFNARRDSIQDSLQATYLMSAPMTTTNEGYGTQSLCFMDDASLKDFNAADQARKT